VDPSPATSLPLIDPDDALRRAGDRPDVASELFALLCDTLDDAVAHVREAARAGNVDALRDTAHRLHGACLYCGVPRLRAAVADVERRCQAGRTSEGALELEKPVSRLLDAMEATRSAADPLAERHG
jgi:two-component system sensor histidine kinase BarA